MSWGDNCQKLTNVPNSNPNPILHNINAHDITDVSRQTTQSKIEEICPLAIPNQISTISMHIHVPSLVKIHWHLPKLLSGNKNMDMLWADNSVKDWGNLPLSNPKPDLLNINAHTKFSENLLIFTLIVRKQKYECTYERWMDGQTDGQTDSWMTTLKPLYSVTIEWQGIKNANLKYKF